MGCDIHFFVEHKKPGSNKWVADEWHKKYSWAKKDKETGEISLCEDEEQTLAELGDTYQEVEIDGEKHLITTFDYNPNGLRIGRNYFLFGLLADVRQSGNIIYDRRGFPEDASDIVREEFERWDTDAHSPSYLTMHEFFRVIDEWKRACLEEARQNKEDTKWVNNAYQEVKDYLYSQNKRYGHNCDEQLFDILAETRVVFWFDN